MHRSIAAGFAFTAAVSLIAVAAPASGHRHGRHPAKPRVARSASPAGTTAVPAGGLKLYCAGSRSPLLVRKFTQGNGTIVTALCR